ncbi:hypothetical protein BLNAU_1245 [Blattamonas nauphoetae]|uniref:Uncharacterized protein n=1 Tax=Blattamonas nauphoetae TaxID=2049346 RepID=A0ABQ9YJ56_9EUKA|nr:hypothetical protein BLNAU_1245 [Blattamonas nauphoetae]
MKFNALIRPPIISPLSGRSGHLNRDWETSPVVYGLTEGKALRSGILEWLVEAVRTHPDGQVRQAIVVGLGEIGFGLKKAVVREKRGDEGWKKEEKKSEKDGAASGLERRGRRAGRAGPRLLRGSISRADLLVLGSESWVEKDTGRMDLASRCRRGVRMAGQALVGVLRGWEKKKGDGEKETDQKGKKVEQRKDDEEQRKTGEENVVIPNETETQDNRSENGEELSEDEEEREWETDIDVLDIAGSVCGMIFPKVFNESRQEKQGRITLSGEDFEELKRKMEEMEKRPAGTQLTELREEMRRKDAFREQERQAERAQFQKEKMEMLRQIDELKNPLVKTVRR